MAVRAADQRVSQISGVSRSVAGDIATVNQAAPVIFLGSDQSHDFRRRCHGCFGEFGHAGDEFIVVDEDTSRFAALAGAGAFDD